MPASPMRVKWTMAAVTSRGPTAAQLTDGSYTNKATTWPDVSESRHSVAVARVGGVHDADNHCSRATSGCPGMGAGVVVNISLGIGSMHYIRIHFGYGPSTLILNALLERKERIHVSCLTRVAILHQIRIQNIRVRIQIYTGLLNFSRQQNSGKTQSTSPFTFRHSRDSCANIFQRQAAFPSDTKGTVQSHDSARLQYQRSVSGDLEWSF